MGFSWFQPGSAPVTPWPGFRPAPSDARGGLCAAAAAWLGPAPITGAPVKPRDVVFGGWQKRMLRISRIYARFFCT